jgi:osmotically-inducible protein OsmY
MSNVRLWSLGVAVLMLVGPGCAREEARETAAEQQSQPADATITMTIQSRYFGDDTVKGHEVDVDTENGLVTLSGTVETAAARSRAETIAQSVDGVTRVQNELRVEPAAEIARAEDPARPAVDPERTGEPASSQVNAGWITTKIQAQYFADPDVKGRNIDVTTSADGQVTLSGEIENDAERQEALRIARATEGVRGVVDKLRMTAAAEPTATAGDRPAARPDDPDHDMLGDTWITMKIESKYFLDNEVKGRNIDVTTLNGVVTLEGEVESAAEKRQATLLAQSTEGVTEVRDQLRVVAPAADAPSREADRPATTTMSDEWIEMKIQSKYFLATDLKSDDIDVAASKGVVTLTGRVETADDKRTAEEIARETDGVRNVVNRIEVGAPAGSGRVR